MLKTRELSVVIGAVLVLFCASAAFAGPPEYKLLDLGAEPEAPAGGGKQLPSLSDCFYGDQSLCDNLSQNVDSTFADSALRCAADEADVATGYWRLFDLDQDNSADPGLGFHADVNGVSVTG